MDKDERDAPTGAPEGRRRRPQRPPLDLTATEVPPESAAAAADAAPPSAAAAEGPSAAPPSSAGQDSLRRFVPFLAAAGVGAAAACLVAIGVIVGLWKVGVMAARDERVDMLAGRSAELDAQVRKLAARDAELDAQLNKLAARDAEMDAQAKGLAAREAERDAQVKALAAREAELDTQVKALAARGTELDTQAKGLAAREAERDAQLKGLAAGDAARDAQVKAIAARDVSDDKVAALSARAKEFDERLTKLEQRPAARDQTAGPEVQALSERMAKAEAALKASGAGAYQTLVPTTELAAKLADDGRNLSKQAGNEWQVAAIADFDGDGKVDILWRNTITGTTNVYQMDGSRVLGDGNTTQQLGTDWEIRGTGDFDGDGKADILWRRADGATLIWFMDGPRVLEAGSATAVAQSGSHAAALASATRPLAEALAAVNKRLDETAAAAEAARDTAASLAATSNTAAVASAMRIESLAGRLAGLEEAQKAIEASLAKPPPDVDGAARLASAATALRAAVERGEPFAAELAAVKRLVPDPAAIAPLEAFAASGVPTGPALTSELTALLAGMRRETDAARTTGEGLFDRLQESATKLVRVRPVDRQAGGAAGDVASIEALAARGDLAAARAEAATLPDAARAPLEGWMRKVDARAAAVARARELARESLDRLAKASR